MQCCLSIQQAIGTETFTVLIFAPSLTGFPMKSSARASKAVPTSSAFTRKRCVSALAIIGIALILGTALGLLDPKRPEATSQQPTLVLAQQVDQLANLYLSPKTANRELAESDRSAVETWLLFDSRFAESSALVTHLRFERAITLRRVGLSNMLLGNTTASAEALDEADSILAQLQEEEPTNISLLIERSGCNAQQAQLQIRIGNRTKAIGHCDDALALLKGKLNGLSEEWDAEVKTPLTHLARLYGLLELPTKAAEVASLNQAVLERLIGFRGGTAEDNALLQECMQIISAAGNSSS